jgi:simple sugar transport system substrate-binding protein
MSDSEFFGDAIERLEWDERKEEESPYKRLRQFSRRTALTGGAAGIAAMVLEACGSSSSSSSGTSSASASTGGGSAASGIFGSSQSYKFTFVNHVTTNPFFTPTQNGAADACKLLGCSYQWTGSATSNVNEMSNAMNSAMTAGVNGLAIALVDQKAFNAPTSKALSSGIPVVAYNADVPTNARLAYIGQDLFVSGQKMGEHIAALVPSGDVALFIATPGSLNIQPRIDGALAVLKSHSSIKTHVVATGAAVPQEHSVIDSYLAGHPNTAGMFAVDGGSTEGVGLAIQKHNATGKVKGGGYDLTPTTEQLVSAGVMQFTIDQQPYLQGFLPILELYMYNVTQKLSGIADVNTGLKFLDKTSMAPYVSTKSRYEGTGTGVGVKKA